MNRRACLATAAVLVLAGCSGSDAATTSSTSTSAGAATTSPATTVAVVSTDTVDTTAAPTTAAVTTTTEPAITYAATVDDLLAIGRPIVLAHTAGEDEFPASTLFGFGESVKAGVDVLDLNVNISSDGELIVQHDDSVDRNTDGTGDVAALTAAQIGALDAAYWFGTDCADCHDRPDDTYLYRGIRTGDREPPAGYTADDFALPTLRQLIERYPDIPLNIEIKGEGDIAKRTADVLAAQLVELGRADATVVASFDDEIVSYFHQIAPDIEVSPGLGVLTSYVLDGTPIPDGMRILQLPPEYSGLQVITPELVARSTADGYPIWVWPNDRSLENESSYRDFLDMGVVGLNINFPAQGIAAVQSYRADAQVQSLASPGCSAAPAAPGETTLDFTSAGLPGTYIQHLPPAYDGTSPMPVVLGLHGWSEPAAILGTQSHLGAAGDNGRFVVVFPDITRPTPLWDTALDGADVEWMGALLDTLEQTLCIDTNRVYVTGMSNGAMMTSTIACTMADRVAAVAPVAGVLLPDGCEPDRPIPIIAFHGTDDQYLAFDGGYGDKVAGLASPDGTGTLGAVEATGPDAVAVPDRVAAWAELDDCAAELTTDTVAADVTVEHTTECATPVELYVVDGGGHTWPGSEFDQSIGDMVGHVTTSIDATDLMVQFFRAHPLG